MTAHTFPTAAALYPELVAAKATDVADAEMTVLVADYELTRLAADVETLRERVARNVEPGALPSPTFAVDQMADYVAAAHLYNELGMLFDYAARESATAADLGKEIRKQTLRSLAYSAPVPQLHERRIRLAQALGLLK